MLLGVPVWFLNGGIATVGAILISTARSELILQLSKCDVQIEGKTVESTGWLH